jgi:multiple sugar transport system ATP-binding protein
VIPVRVNASMASVGDKVTLGIRPEHLDAARDSGVGTLKARVQVAEHLGDITYLHVAVPGAPSDLIVRADADNPLQAAETAYLTLPASRCYLFDAGGKAFARTV